MGLEDAYQIRQIKNKKTKKIDIGIGAPTCK